MGRYRDSGLVHYTFCHVLRRNSDRSSKGATSGMGQSRHSDLTPVTSGLPMKADIFGAGRDLSKVPLPDFRAAQVGDSTPSKSWGPEPGSPFASKPLSLSS